MWTEVKIFFNFKPLVFQQLFKFSAYQQVTAFAQFYLSREGGSQMSKFEEKKNPIPQGKYLPASRFGKLIYTAGMTPRNNGVLIHSGKVRAEEPIENYKGAVIQAVANALTAARNTLSEQEQLHQILSLTVYINADAEFKEHSSIADIASEYLYDALGDAGIGSRAAIGVSSLPGGAPVEIQLIAAVSE